MTLLTTIIPSSIAPLIMILAAFLATAPALAQSSVDSALFTSLATVPAPLLFSPIQSVVPGLAGPPPGAGRMFHGEVKYRLLYVTPRGAVENRISGEKLDLRSGLGYPKELMVLESMSRVQMGRYSARAHLDTYSTGFTGAGSRLDWPEFRVGGDVDLINFPGFRLGGNVDYYLKNPKFVLNDSDIGSTAFETLKPLTGGAHVGYNSSGSTGASWSFDARWRMSMTESLKFDEAEIALGLKTPDTMLGKAALRGGYRYMAVGLVNNPFRVDFAWNGAFLELVCFY